MKRRGFAFYRPRTRNKSMRGTEAESNSAGNYFIDKRGTGFIEGVKLQREVSSSI